MPEPDPPPDLPADLYAWFAVFNEVAIVAQLSRALLEARLPPGMLHAHFGVLSHLVRVGDGPTPLRLATAFQVPKTTMTHTLAGLERLGYVETRPNAEDGRSKRVWITEAGRGAREGVVAALGPDLLRLAGRLTGRSGARPSDLLPGLAELRRVLDADRD